MVESGQEVADQLPQDPDFGAVFRADTIGDHAKEQLRFIIPTRSPSGSGKPDLGGMYSPVSTMTG